jgi:hypothetical protein
MAQLYLSYLKEQTRQGQLGRACAKRSQLTLAGTSASAESDLSVPISENQDRNRGRHPPSVDLFDVVEDSRLVELGPRSAVFTARVSPIGDCSRAFVSRKRPPFSSKRQNGSQTLLLRLDILLLATSSEHSGNGPAKPLPPIRQR